MKDNSVSIAKGIAIILMVLAHTRFSEYGNYWINMFHMPLFFFFAGYCFKDKYLEIPSDFVIKRFKGLYKPFVKWGLIFLVLHNLFFYLNIYNDEFGFRGIVQHLYTWQEMLKKAVSIVTRMSDTEQLLGGYWFLKSLFWGSLIAFFIIYNVKNVKWGGGSVAMYYYSYISISSSYTLFRHWWKRTFCCTIFYFRILLPKRCFLYSSELLDFSNRNRCGYIGSKLLASNTSEI